MTQPNISSFLSTLGSFAERYVPDGYHKDMNLEKKLESMSKITGFKGVLVFYPTSPLPNDPDKIIKMLANHGLKVANTVVENFTDRKWKYGALSTNEEKILKESIKLCKHAIDFTKEFPGASLRVWPSQDGFEYPFQTDYEKSWETLVQSYQEICSHNPDVKISVEYKPKGPRERQYISNIGKMMMLFSDVGMENLTGVLDTGHALANQESLAEDVVILNKNGKLNEIHLNDNYRDSDPNLIFGTIAFWENLEMYYYLNKYKFSGWQEIDIITPRDDRVRALELSVKMVIKYDELAKKLLKHKNIIEKNLNGYHFTENMNLITDLLFK